MKGLLRFFLIVCTLLVLIGVSCSKSDGRNSPPPFVKEEGELNGAPSTSENSVSKEPTVETLALPISLDDRFSYTYGYLLMVTAMRDIQGIDPLYFARGVLDSGLNRTPLINRTAMDSILYEYQDKLIAEATRRLEELAQKNLEDAESFLAVNGKRDGVFTTESGLQYEILKEGSGESPQPTDSVKVDYRLTYLDGREGDASVRGVPSLLHLNSMIPGFREGLMLMNEKSQFRFFVHPTLGYGEAGSTRIEPNTLLIFDVELVEIVH